MSPQRTTRLAAIAAALALGLASTGCGDEDTETDAAQAPTTEKSSPAATTDDEPVGEPETPAEAAPAEAQGQAETLPPSAEQAAEEALARIDDVNQNTADSVREAARRFDAERERAGGTVDERVKRARDGLERAVQDADPRAREELQGIFERIDAQPGTAELAAEQALSQVEGVDPEVAARVRDAARTIDKERSSGGAATGETVERARGGIERAVQDADPRTREQLEGLLGKIDDQLATQGSGGG
jgi:uncharacterized protein YicC (UPF0701 family)